MPNTVTVTYGGEGGIPLTKSGLDKAKTKRELDVVCAAMSKAKATIKSMRVEFSDGTIFTAEKE